MYPLSVNSTDSIYTGHLMLQLYHDRNACKWCLSYSMTFQSGDVLHFGSNVTHCFYLTIFTRLMLIIHLPFSMWIMSILIPMVIGISLRGLKIKTLPETHKFKGKIQNTLQYYITQQLELWMVTVSLFLHHTQSTTQYLFAQSPTNLLPKTQNFCWNRLNQVFLK